MARKQGSRNGIGGDFSEQQLVSSYKLADQPLSPMIKNTFSLPIINANLNGGGGGGVSSNEYIKLDQHLDDSSQNGETISRRRFDSSQHLAYNGPCVTKSAGGVISIEMDSMNEDSGFYVRWNNLTYSVESNLRQNLCGSSSKKTILDQLDGFFLSGELVALMGPSGAGKTTLLNCLCLKNKYGVNGEIMVVGKPRIRVAVVPQFDDFLPQFTVTEIIFYASRYKNRTYDISHRAIVKRVIQQLGLEVCQNNSISRCSGGQRKRVAIAQELVKKPNILILDEPTSGLDSSSCYQTIEVLRSIIDNSSASTPMSIVTTIHQPSAKVMSLFDRIYLLAAGGRLAFNGGPREIVPLLERIGSPCPPFYNPIDHMIELVSGDYGKKKVDRMIRVEKSKKIVFNRKLEAVSAQNLRKAILYDPCPFKDHTWIHTQRCTMQLLRDYVLYIRIVCHFSIAFFFAYLWGLDIGKGTACPTFNKQNIGFVSSAFSANLTKEELQDSDRTRDNMIFIIYGATFIMYAACMITVINFPLDVKVLSKEYFNGWYTVSSYLTGRIASDFPFLIFCVSMFGTICWLLSSQPSSVYHWRYFVYIYCLISLSLISQAQGLIVGAIFMNNLSASVFVGPLSVTPMFMFSGYARSYARTADYLKPLVKLSYFHHAVRTIYAALYGFGRCKCNPNDYQLDMEYVDYEDMNSIVKTQSSLMIPANGIESDTIPIGSGKQEDSAIKQQIFIGGYSCDDSFQSLVMGSFDIEDNDMYIGMAILFAYIVVLRVVVLLLLMFKVRR